MPVFDIVCLANSTKLRGTCVAGLRLDGGGWIRPVARTPHGELYSIHYRLQDGSGPRVLDVLRIEFECATPPAHQPENWLIGDEPWQLLHRGLPPELAPMLRASIVNGPLLLGDGARRIAFEHFTQMPASASLALVAPSDVEWLIEQTPYNERKPSAMFRLRGKFYKLPVTDPIWLDALRALPLGVHGRDACGIDPATKVLLTVSLGEPFDDGYCYKLVTAILPLRPGF